MTFREVYIAFDTISKRRRDEMKFQARCLGAEIKDDDKFVTAEELTDRHEEAMDKAIQEQMAKKGLKHVRCSN